MNDNGQASDPGVERYLRLKTLAAALRSRFGEEAVGVAHRQAKEAIGENQKTWLDLIDLLNSD